MRRTRKADIWSVTVLVLTSLAVRATAQENRPPIIPGAYGFGMETPAGSGRHLDPPKTRVIKVTNLNTEGPGSLREALAAEGPRVVVFEVSGNIDFTPIGGLNIRNSYVTVAGQTAPSPGITLKGCQLNVSANDVLLSHIRVRVGDLRDPNRPERDPRSGWTQWSERDNMKVSGDRIVIDHCSFSWATDENVQTRGNDLTFRHNIISEALDSARHHKGGHSRGLLIMNQGPNDTRREGQRIAVIGNLFVHNKGRNPTINGGAVGVIANNLIDDAHFAMKGDCTARRGHQLISAMGNVVKRTRYPIVARAMHPDTRYYFGPDNIFNGKMIETVAAIWESQVFMPFQPGVPEKNRATEPPVAVPGYAVKPAVEVEEWVLATAGARPADRDPVDARVVKDVREQTGSILASQADVGGWPELKENRRELKLPEDPNRDDDGNGYTNLEQWLHGYAARAENQPTRPNVLLILADDVGREVLGCYGGESYDTPCLDALAAGGKRFTHCYSMPVCHPSRICLMTGRYPVVLGNPRWGSFAADEEGRTFAAVLKKAGYATAVAGKWQLSLMKNDSQQPARMGFDEWSLFGWHEGPRYHDPMIYQNGRLRTDTEGEYGPDLYVDFLIDFIRRNRARPFFAYYSMALCHDVTDDIGKPVPYGPDGRWLSYEEMAEDMDRQVGRLVAALDHMQLRDNTLILYTTDNGTAASSYLKYENGKFERPKVFSRIDGRLMQGGKGQLTDWGTRVPLIAHWPGHVEAGTVCDELIDFSDFLPTLADLASAPLPENVTINGCSFARSLRGKGQTSRRWAYSESSSQRRYVRTQRYKLYSSGEFFDMSSDPSEQRRLADEELTKHRREVKEMLQAALDTLPAIR